MPTLADIYSMIDSAKRRGTDFIRNPGTSLQQMVGNANDKARAFNELNDAALDEFRATGDLYGPKNKELAQSLAGAYNPVGMTVIPFGKTRNVTVPIGQDVAAVNPVEIRARQAIDDLVNHAKYFGVDSPIDHTKMPVGGVMAHLDDYLGRSQAVSELPDAAKASLRNLWQKAENAANAYKRVYGEEKMMGKPQIEPYESNSFIGFGLKNAKKELDSGQITQAEYDKQVEFNANLLEKAQRFFEQGKIDQKQLNKYKKIYSK